MNNEGEIGALLGDMAPNFVADSTQGRVGLGSVLSQSKVIVAFFKDDFSPHCRSLLGVLQDFQPQFERAGASIVALAPIGLERLAALAAEMKLSYPLATDPKLTIARAFLAADDGDTEPQRSIFIVEQDWLVVLAIANYHPANITQLEAIFLALELAEEDPPTMGAQRVDSPIQRFLHWF